MVSWAIDYSDSNHVHFHHFVVILQYFTEVFQSQTNLREPKCDCRSRRKRSIEADEPLRGGIPYPRLDRESGLEPISRE